ncbi:MAG: Protein crcB homolog 1 [uncultured Thiotrichaceae bacterium]|uniref:Protein crcB homolog 1 n=1 Tax=uncultured Thiotrichaceae bacterium TaxID=298394 RepID=A0A6S6U3D6_9GAMM|nr:MAG: Protein crcB homolog 1 [uncultured Thiotrichaceae bacterium]
MDGIKSLSAIFFGTLFFASTQLMAADSLIIKKESQQSVAETMDKFESIVKAKGLGVFGRVNHQENAKKVDMEMGEAEVLIFGNPKMGTVLMKQDIAVALDLPMKVVVYKDADGKVFIAYRSPKALLADYALEDNPALDKATGALDKLTSAAIK